MTMRITHPTDRANFSRVETENAGLWFSYETCIAFSHPETGLVVHENIWSTTTGKHLNYIDNGTNSAKAARVDAETFATLARLAGL